MDIEVITQIAIAIGIVLVFRILSSAVSSIIIKILTYKKGCSVKEHPLLYFNYCPKWHPKVHHPKHI